MRTLSLTNSSMSYSGLFEEPIFPVWKRGSIKLVEDFYNLLRGFDVSLEDITFVSDGENFEQDSLTINFDEIGQYTLKLTGVEFEVEGFLSGNAEPLFSVLELIDKWLQPIGGSLKYSSHFLEYGGHGFIDDLTTAQEYLQAYPQKKLLSVPQGLANGLIFTWANPDINAKTHVEIDHSFDFPEGLFLRYLTVIRQNRLNYNEIGSYYLKTLLDVVAELGLSLKENV